MQHKYRREKRFLESLCKGHIKDLLEDVGWTELQCEIIKKRYLEFRSAAGTSMDIGFSDSQYRRITNKIYDKLRSYMIRQKDDELAKIYWELNE